VTRPARTNLLAHARPSLGKRVYAFPEANGLGKYTVWGTGMLSTSRKRVTAYLECRGFTVPEGEQWGPQERFAYRLRIAGPRAIASLPDGFTVRLEQNGPATVIRLLDPAGSVVGTASVGEARAADREMPNAVYMGWLGIDQSFAERVSYDSPSDADRARSTERQDDMFLTTHSGRPAWKVYETSRLSES